MRWCIYYGDDSTFSIEDGTAWIAPALDVQVIVIEDKDHGWRTQTGSDYYVYDVRGSEPAWWGVDIFGMFEYLFTRPGYKRVLAGRTLTSERYSEIFKRAKEDPNFGKKTAFRRRERKP